MAIRQQNSDPVERGGFCGCRIQISSDRTKTNHSSYSIWLSDSGRRGEWSESEWCLDSVDAIDDLIDLLKELREVKDDDCV